MNENAARTGRRCTVGVMLSLAALFVLHSVHAQDAATLRARQAVLRDQLANSEFQRPLVLESTQTDSTLKGDVYAVVTQPFTVVGQALDSMDHWCDVLILHLNVKNCRARVSDAGNTLSVAVGRKFYEPLESAYRVEFTYRVVASDPNYLVVLLNADVGPLGTKNYRIVLEAVPLDTTSTFVHLSYSYGYGMLGRVAMRGYLETIGRNKVGFSIIERKADGTPVYVADVRGVIERNTMRYYLAIEAYLGAYALPVSEQPEKRLRAWFDAIERYPRQLHELERDEYLSMKRRELARQDAMAVKAN
jgi:hypothetical protein